MSELTLWPLRQIKRVEVPSQGEFVHGFCMLYNEYFAERILIKESGMFFAHIESFDWRNPVRIFEPQEYFDMFVFNDEFVTTTWDGFIVWEPHVFNPNNPKIRTVTTNLKPGTFDNCKQYSQTTFICYPSCLPQSGIYIINFADGALVQRLTSDVLSQEYVAPNKLSLIDKFIVYTVMDCSKEREKWDLQKTIYVSKRPQS